MTLKFTHRMFPRDMFPEDCAQKVFDTWLAEQKLIFKHKGEVDAYWRPFSLPEDTHRARLVCIEELPKKQCEHEPMSSYNAYVGENLLTYKPGLIPECRHCGIALRATAWEPA